MWNLPLLVNLEIPGFSWCQRFIFLFFMWCLVSFMCIEILLLFYVNPPCTGGGYIFWHLFCWFNGCWFWVPVSSLQSGELYLVLLNLEILCNCRFWIFWNSFILSLDFSSILMAYFKIILKLVLLKSVNISHLFHFPPNKGYNIPSKANCPTLE